MTADEIVNEVEKEQAAASQMPAQLTDEMKAEMAAADAKAEEAKKATKTTRSRKKVDGDAILAKQRGTFAVGIQAAMRDLIRNR